MEPGEKLISQAAGDTLRWQIAQTYSGEGQDLRQHILVKPNKPDLENTLLITTNKRTYHLILKSSESSAYMVSVKWDYPKNMVYVYNGDTQGNAGFNSSPGYNMDLSTLNFNYKVSMYEGKKIPDWYPQRVFSNGRQTFIEFSKSFQSSDLPILVVKRDDGTDATMVNWRLRGKFMIVDSVLQNAFLQTGVDKTGKTMVEIAQVGKQS
jgi:type IV secretion system protein VirB9